MPSQTGKREGCRDEEYEARRNQKAMQAVQMPMQQQVHIQQYGGMAYQMLIQQYGDMVQQQKSNGFGNQQQFNEHQ